MAKASARHILVSTADECKELMAKIEEGADFAELAGSHSSCPSGKKGGDLGEFLPGQMVPEFDDVVFSEELGKVHGPIKTDFGFHLIEIMSREDDTENKKTTAAEKQERPETVNETKVINPFLGEERGDHSKQDYSEHCQTIFDIAKAIKGLGCKDFFFLQPLSVDHRVVNAYQDHLITIQNLVKIFQETSDIKKQKEGAEEAFLRLRTVMMEVKEKIIDPIQKDVKGDSLKTFTEYVDKWNNTIDDVLEVDKAWGQKYEVGKPLKVEMPALAETSK
jgi:peptidyl-prolyl cis-trans isomerase C|tara:strand:- start:8116 stop:8946 length:831 start_codon:yes stop_codon:yes gene_type:complete